MCLLIHSFVVVRLYRSTPLLPYTNIPQASKLPRRRNFLGGGVIDSVPLLTTQSWQDETIKAAGATNANPPRAAIIVAPCGWADVCW